ncbi:MAG: sugar phosphate nucleotidyltransferase [Promethearchaeota archaeon]
MWLICPIAGVGKRLQPFTYSKPKAFLKIAGRRLIDHILIALKRTFPEGSNLLFIVGYKKKLVTEYITSQYSDYFNLVFVEQEPLGYSAETPYFSGLGDAVLLAKDYAQGDDCFVFLSDRLPMEDYSQLLLRYHQGDCDGVINVKKVEKSQLYGVTVLDADKKYVTQIIEKPKQFVSEYAVAGAYLFGKSYSTKLFQLLEAQSKIPLENGEEHTITSVIEQLIKIGSKIAINEMKSSILDFGHPETLLDGNQQLLSGLKNDDPLYEELRSSKNIVASKIIPPVFIGNNVKITDSVIGPNISIGDDVHLYKCILSESVIGDGARLDKIITSKSIIGDYSILEDLIKNEITIGDSSYIASSNL